MIYKKNRKKMNNCVENQFACFPFRFGNNQKSRKKN
jgi:hypothetical protein